MRHLFVVVLCLAACDPSSPPSVYMSSPNPRPPLGPPGCARPIPGGYMDERLGTPCHFAMFRGAKVCVPDNMGLAIFGVCDPNGGPDRIWVNREPNCLGNGTSKYIISTMELSCDALGGNIQVVDPLPLSDQVLYTNDRDGKNCMPSALSGNSLHPVHAIAPPPAPRFIYETDLPGYVCK